MDRSLAIREKLRRRYRPKRVRILFVGESPPASGRFFYQADSGLYRAIRQTFIKAFPRARNRNFLEAFAAMGCYLVDLCGKPVDKLSDRQRKQICKRGEPRLVRLVRRLRPEIVVSVVRSIGPNVGKSLQAVPFEGPHLNLPYPGRWEHNRRRFVAQLVPLLRKTLED